MSKKKTPAPTGIGAGAMEFKNQAPQHTPPAPPSQDIIARIAAANAVRDTERWFHLKLEAARQFAALNGWRRAKHCFSPQDIGKRGWGASAPMPLFDHPIYFAGGGRNVALVGQPYGHDIERTRREGEQLAARLGLAFSIAPRPRVSFHCPGATLFAVLHAKDHEMRWLPEQE